MVRLASLAEDMGRAEMMRQKSKARELLQQAGREPIPRHGSCEGGLPQAYTGRWIQGEKESRYYIVAACPGMGESCYTWWQSVAGGPWEQVAGDEAKIPTEQVLLRMRVTPFDNCG